MNASSKFCRREFLRMGAMAAAGTALAACAPQAAPEPAAPEVVKETVVVTETVIAEPAATYEQGEITVLVCCSGPDEQEAKLQFNERFVAARQGVKVNLEPMPAGQNYFEKLQTVIAAGTAPDIFDMWEGYVQPYAQNGALTNLEPFFEKDGKLKKEDLWPGGLPAVSWEGQLYSMLIAIMPGPVSLYYNKKLLEKHGIDKPTGDWTWDQMREAAMACTITGETEQYGLVFDTWFVPWTYWIWSHGGDIFNEDETKCIINEDKACEAVQYWADLVVKDKCAPSGSTMSAMQGSFNMFKTDMVAMYLGNCWDVPAMKDAATQGLEWGACLAPKANDGNRVFYQHTWCWGIWTGTPKPNLCWEYVRDFVLDEEMITQFNTFQKAFPSVKSLLHTFTTPETEELGWTGVIDIVGDTSKLRYPGSGAKWDKISGMIQAEMIDLAFTGDQTAKAGADIVVPKVDEELARA